MYVQTDCPTRRWYTHRLTNKKMDRKRVRLIYRQIDKQKDGKTKWKGIYWLNDEQADGQKKGKIDIQTDWRTKRSTYRWTDWYTYK